MSFRSGRAKIKTSVVSTAAQMSSSVNIVPMVSETSFGLRAAKYCATSTVPPTDRPLTAIATRCVIWLPLFTPVSTGVSQNQPTTSTSTMPYRACRRFASRNGMQKEIRCLDTLPSVKSFSSAFANTNNLP